MVAAIALILMTTWRPVQSPAAESAAVAQIFVDACLNGSLTLPKGAARVIPAKEVPAFADDADLARKPTSEKAVKFDKPPATYLMVVDYDRVQARGVSKICAVTSRRLNRVDAFRALMAGSAGMRVEGDGPWWVIDAPRLGYCKMLTLQSDYSVVLEMRTYVHPW